MTRRFVPLALFLAAVAACNTTNVPDDPGERIFTPVGVIQGTLIYQGPHPCSSNGHIVGAAIIFVFDRRNPPPPTGTASTPANLAVVTGDALFANEPRYTGSTVYCPVKNGITDTITVSSPFAVSPLNGGSYEIQSFYDSTGDFLPTFKYRSLPEMGDVAGGDIDTAAALQPINANINYLPNFLPVNVGIPEPGSETTSLGGSIPVYDIPSTGYVAQNVTVSVGSVLSLTRPYFYAQGLPYGSGTLTPPSGSPNAADGKTIYNTPPNQSSDGPATSADGLRDGTAGALDDTAETDANYAPVLIIPQDIATFGAPDPTDLADARGNVDVFESVLPHLNLVFGVPPTEELACATGGACSGTTAGGQVNPFNFQLTPGGTTATSEGSFSVWQDAYFDATQQQWLPVQIPEGNNVPQLWPLVVLNKLVDSSPPDHPEDPAGITTQGGPGQPVVIMQGITLLNASQNDIENPGLAGQSDTLYNTLLAEGAGILPSQFFDSPGIPHVFPQDHLTVAVRPSAFCFSHLYDTTPAPDSRGIIATPYSDNQQATFGGNGAQELIVPGDLLTNGDRSRLQVTGQISGIQFGCLPRGRYSINVLYPDGQAWTVPNETGACSGSEGSTDFGGLTCTLKPRPVLYSQGNRAVVEVVGPINPNSCQTVGPAPVVTPTIGMASVGTGSGQAPAPATPVACLARCETQACSGSDKCTQVTDTDGSSAMVCIPPLPSPVAQ